MILTGKCKQDFESWFNREVTDKRSYGAYLLGRFYGLPLSMQFGVVQEFADSVGVRLDACSDTVFDIDSNGFTYKITTVKLQDVNYYPFKEYRYKDIDSCGGYKPRQEAQQAAIAKFNEIYNER